jgi:hypothetical protein
MRYGPFILAFVLAAPAAALADKPVRNDGLPPGQAKKASVPPGLAKKNGMPPGLAKKFGATPPAQAYVAFDPRYDDRAWFLVDGRWVLRRNFEPTVRVEVRQAMALPPVPPPVPLPALDIAFRVVVFQ